MYVSEMAAKRKQKEILAEQKKAKQTHKIKDRSRYH